MRLAGDLMSETHNLPGDTDHSKVSVNESRDVVSEARDRDPESQVTVSHSNVMGSAANVDNKINSADVEAQLDAMAELVARVRHEINNPLTGVLGQAQLLLREDLSEKARKRVETIEALAIRLRDIVGQLREVQRPRREE